MMESTQRRAEEAVTPLKSAVGDVRRVKSSGTASVQELKEFLRQHRGKSSQELLGELGKTSLFQAMVKSTVGCLALLTALTVIPYFVQGKQQSHATSPAAPQAAALANTGTAAPPATSVAATGEATSKNTAPNGIDVDKAKKVMRLDETKSAPDNVNPREKDLDNLLDGVK